VSHRVNLPVDILPVFEDVPVDGTHVVHLCAAFQAVLNIKIERFLAKILLNVHLK
jgi:hypothetical protein